VAEDTELEDLRRRLEEAEATLSAIRKGEVDALVVSGQQGEQVYTLRGADHSYRVLLQQMNEGAATLLPDGTILYCNNRLAEMLKIPLENVMGSSIYSFIVPMDQHIFEDLLLRGRQDRVKAEITLEAGNGQFVVVYCSLSPVQIDDMQCLCVVATDLTEQKRNEEIVAAEKLARSILEQAADVIVVCDEDGKIIQASRAAHELSGRNVLYEQFHAVFPLRSNNGTALSCSVDEGGSGEESFVSVCLGGRTMQGVEAVLERLDGNRFDLLLSAGPLRDSQQRVRGCVFTLTDITQRKRDEEAVRRSEERLRQQAQELEQQLIASGRLVSLGEITASMAHEFNNPLGIIMGFTQDLLSEVAPSSANYQALKIIGEESKRCEKIIQDLLQFAGPRSADLCTTDVRLVIEKTLALVANHLYKQKIETVTEIEENLPNIHADPQQLEQVLVNLYLNAIDSMPDGGTLTVKANTKPPMPGADSSRSLAITVGDTGFGIEEKDLLKIFQPFFTAKKKRGLGLGLPICDRIVKNHGGRIEVESLLGQGTTFKVYLPLDR
jgi:PAS domain S-box-containing protein